MSEIIILVFTVQLIILTISVIVSNTDGFSMKIIPIESPHLRILPDHLTEYERVQFLANISISRVLNMRKDITPDTMKSKLLTVKTRFVTQIGLGGGEASNKHYVIFDTGSDLTWVQCEGCKDCFDVVPGAVFRYKQSPSFQRLSVYDKLCLQPQYKIDGSCGFRIKYDIVEPYPMVGGLVGRDTFFLTNDDQTSAEFTYPSFAFGCALETKVFNFGPQNSVVGVFGLSPASRSFISQLDAETKGRFSYCLAPHTEPSLAQSSVYFGDDAQISGDDTRQVQTISMHVLSKIYHLYLNGISVDGRRLPIDPSVFQLNEQDLSKGGFFIDSGAPYTTLARKAYDPLRKAVRRYLRDRYGWEPRPPGGLMDLCYASYPNFNGRKFPSVIFHFRNNGHSGEVDMVMGRDHIFQRMGPNQEVCMAIIPVNDPGPCLFGAYQQINFNILYDVRNSLLSFVPDQNCREN